MTWPPHGGEHASEAGPPSKQRERTGGGLKARSSLVLGGRKGLVGGRRSDLGEPEGRWRAVRKEEISAVSSLTMTDCDRERPWTRSPATRDVEQTFAMARFEPAVRCASQEERKVRAHGWCGTPFSHTTRGSSGFGPTAPRDRATTPNPARAVGGRVAVSASRSPQGVSGGVGARGAR